MSTTSFVDHLVVAARSLAHGVAWCEATFGVTPGPGGQHPLMGTHNRLLRVASGRYPRAYLEIIAVDEGAAAPVHPRWFDLDDPALQRAIGGEPRLVHFVARCDDAAAALAALRSRGHDPGDLVAAQREARHGLLRWRITVRADGRRQFHGALPSLIQWLDAHPADDMARSAVALRSLRIQSRHADELANAYSAIGLDGIAADCGTPDLVATFDSPRGPVTLRSMGY